MGSGVSKKVHEDEVAKREQKIKQLEEQVKERDSKISGMVSKEDLEAQKATMDTELQTVQAKVAEAEQTSKEKDGEIEQTKQLAGEHEAQLETLRAELAAETAKLDILEQEKSALAHTLDVAGKALSHVHDYPADENEIARAKRSAPLHPEVDEDTHAAIVNDNSILPEELQTGIATMQTQMRDLESMQAAVKLSQEKVSEYWKKVQTSENLLMEQRKHILQVENANEMLKTERVKQAPTPTKAGRAAQSRPASRPGSSGLTRSPGRRQSMADHRHDFIPD